MGTGNFSSFDNHLSLIDKKTVDGNIYRKIGSFISFCLLFLVNSATLFFRFMAGRVFRAHNRDESSLSEPRELNQDSKAVEKKGEDFLDENFERRMPAFSFKYQIQNFEDKFKLIEEEEEKEEAIEISENKDEYFTISAGVDDYQFSPDKEFSGFMEEPEGMTFHAQESLVSFEEENFNKKHERMRFLNAEDFLKPPIELIFEEEDSGSNEYKDLNLLYKKGIKEDILELNYRLFESEKFNSMSSETNSMKGRGIRFITEDFSAFDFDSDTESSSDGYSVKELLYDSDIYGFLSEKDFGEEEHGSENIETSLNSINKLEKGQHEPFFLKGSFYYDDDHHGYLNGEHVVDEAISGEMLHSPAEKETSMESNSDETSAENELTGKPETELGLQIEFVEDSSDDEFPSVKNGSGRLDIFGEVHFVKDVAESESRPEVLDAEQAGKIAVDGLNNNSIIVKNVSEVPTEKKTNESDAWKESEAVKMKEESKTLDFNSEELDELWEHQELIEQLKMELKKVRAVGLPTIFEESESPRGIEDLKPFRIDEKFLHEDPLDELQQFYKNYREGMRKLDILNYQKMYAMGFLQLKNPLHSLGTQRPVFPTIMSQLCLNFLPFWQKKSDNDPSEKLIEDLRCDLETVYVGQTCLSWEFLRWQYEKSLELPDSDPHRSHQYNQAAGEFQKFQVLIKRFTEDEHFQGPRLPNYVKQRCVLRNLLQVPFMKDDCLEDKAEKKESEYVITSEMLEDIMEEAIRIFWEFVKAEKHETPLLLKVLVENKVEVQEPSDYLFMEEIQSNLQKKEKKLKDLLRTGNCIVKKFKKPQEDRSNQDLFFSQVDLKLVARVLRMSRITSDQLIWCHKKLSKINFSLRKVHREQSFLLFPC